MARRRIFTARPPSEISLTPLMDLSFLLLITFIITFPLMEYGVPINLPVARAEELKPHDAVTVTIDSGGKLFLDSRPVAAGDLAARMCAIGRTAPSATVLVRADEAVRYGEVMRVLKIVRESGMSKIALVTKGETKRP